MSAMAARATQGFVADLVLLPCLCSGFRQVSLVVNAEQTEVTDISIEVRDRSFTPLCNVLKYIYIEMCSV